MTLEQSQSETIADRFWRELKALEGRQVSFGCVFDQTGKIVEVTEYPRDLGPAPLGMKAPTKGNNH